MEGQDMGKDERISVEDAIRGYTINAAHSVFLENEKGSIEVNRQDRRLHPSSTATY